MMQPWDRLLLVRVKGFENGGEDDWMVTPLTAKMTDRCVESFEEPSPPPTFEQVRGKLTELSRAGHSGEVRALLQKHGAQKLSEVPESDYAQLLYDAEAIGNAS